MANLFGHGSHGQDILSIWNRVHGSMLHVYDDDPAKERLPDKSAYDEPGYVGINDPKQRHAFVESRMIYGASPLVDPSAVIDHDTRLGLGVVIGPHSTILTDCVIGSHTHINYSVHMTRCTVGSFVTISPGVTICGDVTIGSDTFIGAGAIICNLVSIGTGCTIGAGALVLKDVPDGATVWGVPARAQ